MIRPYVPEDRAGVRALLTRAMGTPLVFDRFSDGNPLGAFVAVVAEHAGAIVGFNMWNPWLVQGASGPIVAHQSGASAVDESMRGQGVFGKLLRRGEELARERGVTLLFGFPNKASLPGFLKAGWEHLRSLRVYACLVPALSAGRLFAARAPHPTPGECDSEMARFVSWRYARAGAESQTVRLPGGRAATVYVRTERRGIARVHRLLDVIDASGRRVSNHLAAICAALPGPGITFLRAALAPGRVPAWMPVRREWDTPLIWKRLSDRGPESETLHHATYWYGDIDAS